MELPLIPVIATAVRVEQDFSGCFVSIVKQKLNLVLKGGGVDGRCATGSDVNRILMVAVATDHLLLASGP